MEVKVIETKHSISMIHGAAKHSVCKHTGNNVVNRRIHALIANMSLTDHARRIVRYAAERLRGSLNMSALSTKIRHVAEEETVKERTVDSDVLIANDSTQERSSGLPYHILQE
jgi:hypothetical protein